MCSLAPLNRFAAPCSSRACGATAAAYGDGVRKPPSTAEIIADAEWLPHRYDASTDSVQFRLFERARHGEGPFLTDEYLGLGTATPVAFDTAMANAKSGELNFIFHSAFCASTLLARAFDYPGVAMGLSEPVILNDIVGIRRRGAAPRDVGRALDGAMRLLSRPFGDGENVVVKSSNVLNPLADAMLSLRPHARAILLYAPLPVFLASVARKGMWCRLWARELLEGYLTDQIVDLGMTAQDHFRQTDLQVAAVGWLAQHALFAKLASKFGPERVRTLDSETLIARPVEVLGTLASLFRIEASPEQIVAMRSGPAFTRHSKSGDTFSSDQRREEQRAATDTFADEIDKVVLWAVVVAEHAGISMELPQAIL